MSLAGDVRGERTQYRPDLDGLRALAVVPVILFHLNIRNFAGGFVGVDVFFVLSGFLITNMLAADLAGGGLSILNFYDRRIRRIVPALIVMLAVCTLAAPLVLFPTELANFGLSVAAAALSVSNILFFLQSDYFAEPADSIPLLHTWSLGVEEQFYIVFPLLLYAAWTWARRSVGPLLCLLLAVSLGLSIWGTTAMPAATFYLLPTRAWELLLGSVLALHVLPHPRSTLQREIAALTGVVMIGCSVHFLSRETPFPGLAAVPPCLGAALVIWSGLAKSAEPFRVQRLLGARPMVFIGLISYSLYLWHWPFIVFAKYLTVGTLSRPVKLLLFVLMFAVATASWRYVEVPLRKGLWPWPTRRLRFAGAAFASIILIAGGLWFQNGAGHSAFAANNDALVARANAVAAHTSDFSPHRKRCHFKAEPKPLGDYCVLGTPGAPPSVVLLADSHGVEFAGALAELASARNQSVRQITVSGCPPALDFIPRPGSGCADFNASILAALMQVAPTTIVVTARYFLWATGTLGDKFWDGFDATIAGLRKAGHRVIIIGPIPTATNLNTPIELAKFVRFGGRPGDFRIPLDAAAPDVEARLKPLAERHGASYVPFVPFLCSDESGCRVYRDDTVMYLDDNHLTMSGARVFARQFLQPLVWPAAAAAAAVAEPK